MHHARPWAKEQPAWGDEVLNRHSTPNLVHLVYLVCLVCLVFGLNETNQNKPNKPDKPEYSGVGLPSAMGILKGHFVV